MSRFRIYAAESGKTVASIPAIHTAAERLIDRWEAGGRHVAELVYCDEECVCCGIGGESLKLCRDGEGLLALLCEGCHEMGC